MKAFQGNVTGIQMWKFKMPSSLAHSVRTVPQVCDCAYDEPGAS